MTLPRVGLIGLGIMGMAYATNLRRAGATVLGFDPVAEARAALDSLGGQGCATAAGWRRGRM